MALALALAAAFGFGVAGTMFWRATTVTHPAAAAAHARIDALVDSLAAVAAPGGEVSRLHALVWHPRSQRLVEAQAPLWFVAMKEPAMGWVLRGVDFDLREHGLSVDQMRAHGPGLLVDERLPDGERRLLWLQ